jgi:hypothetical protein
MSAGHKIRFDGFDPGDRHPFWQRDRGRCRDVQMTRYDEFAAEKIREGRGVVGLYPPTDASRAEFAVWNNRRL